MAVGSENEILDRVFVLLLGHGILVYHNREGMIVITAGTVLQGVQIFSVLANVSLELLNEIQGCGRYVFRDPSALCRVGLCRPKGAERG